MLPLPPRANTPPHLMTSAPCLHSRIRYRRPPLYQLPDPHSKILVTTFHPRRLCRVFQIKYPPSILPKIILIDFLRPRPITRDPSLLPHHSKPNSPHSRLHLHRIKARRLMLLEIVYHPSHSPSNNSIDRFSLMGCPELSCPACTALRAPIIKCPWLEDAE